jgi:hypothetical protein
MDSNSSLRRLYKQLSELERPNRFWTFDHLDTTQTAFDV